MDQMNKTTKALGVFTWREDPLHVVLLGHAEHGQHGAKDGIEKGHHPIDCQTQIRWWIHTETWGTTLMVVGEVMRVPYQFVHVLWYSPLESERFASVWTTKKCGKIPGWNLVRISSMMSLMYLLPTATRMLLAACCQSGITSWVNREVKKKRVCNVTHRTNRYSQSLNRMIQKHTHMVSRRNILHLKRAQQVSIWWISQQFYIILMKTIITGSTLPSIWANRKQWFHWVFGLSVSLSKVNDY